MVYGARIFPILGSLWFIVSAVITVLVAYWVYSAQARLKELVVEVRELKEKLRS